MRPAAGLLPLQHSKQK